MGRGAWWAIVHGLPKPPDMTQQPTNNVTNYSKTQQHKTNKTTIYHACGFCAWRSLEVSLTLFMMRNLDGTHPGDLVTTHESGGPLLEDSLTHTSGDCCQLSVGVSVPLHIGLFMLSLCVDSFGFLHLLLTGLSRVNVPRRVNQGKLYNLV